MPKSIEEVVTLLLNLMKDVDFVKISKSVANKIEKFNYETPIKEATMQEEEEESVKIVNIKTPSKDKLPIPVPEKKKDVKVPDDNVKKQLKVQVSNGVEIGL